ncbi:MAG TPA: sigma-70 family RNA polymerase sigma factor [Chloroflexia bacterium]|nr:sigma-70 family RNA polymerase sigma factor [Chloroflexia bacterium]
MNSEETTIIPRSNNSDDTEKQVTNNNQELDSAESQKQDAGISDEARIVARVLAGDIDAFSELVERYKGAVYNLCARMLNNPAEAEDAAQEVFVRAFTQLHTYQPTRRFSTWILAVANHYCIDVLRRRKAIMVDLDTVAFQAESKQPEPEEQALLSEARSETRNLLNTLPEKYRAITIMRYWEDLSYEEIAEATGLTIATVKTRLFRARELLAKELARQNNNSSETSETKPKRTTRRATRSPQLVASRTSI